MGFLEDIVKGAQNVAGQVGNVIVPPPVREVAQQAAGAVVSGAEGLAGSAGRYVENYVAPSVAARSPDIRAQEVQSVRSGVNDLVSGTQGLIGGAGKYVQGYVDDQRKGAGDWIDRGAGLAAGAGRYAQGYVEGQQKGAQDWLNRGGEIYRDSGVKGYVDSEFKRSGERIDTYRKIAETAESKVRPYTPLGVAEAAAGAVGALGVAILTGKGSKAGAVNPDAGIKGEYDKANQISGGADRTGKYAEQPGAIDATYTETQVNRPGSKSVNDLGFDRKTWSLIAEGYSPLQAVTMRIGEETNPKLKRELDWQQGQLLQNDIEASSAEHHGKAASTNPADWTPNTKENVGDMALAIKQGSRVNRKSQLSDSNPAVSGILADLPGGYGQEDFSWEQAKDGFTKKAPSLLKAVTTLEAARKNKDMGVYGGLIEKRDATPFLPEVTYNKKIGAATVNGLPNKEWDVLATVMGKTGVPTRTSSYTVPLTPKTPSVRDASNAIGAASVSGSESVKTLNYYDNAMMRGDPVSMEQARAMAREDDNAIARRAAAMGGFGGKKKHTPTRPKTRAAKNRTSDKLVNDILYGRIKPTDRKIKTHKSGGDALMNEILYGKPTNKRKLTAKPTKKPIKTPKKKGFNYSNVGI